MQRLGPQNTHLGPQLSKPSQTPVWLGFVDTPRKRAGGAFVGRLPRKCAGGAFAGKLLHADAPASDANVRKHVCAKQALSR